MYHVLPRIRYYKPSSLKEAVELLAGTPGAMVIAGGTDLLIDMKYGRKKPAALIDITGIPGLAGITLKDNHLEIGAAATLEEILRHRLIVEHAPLLAEAVYNMASWQIRNTGTIGGNLCNASPAADTAPPLLVYGAELVAVGPRGERVISIEEFFTGPKKTVLGPGEILVNIRIPLPPRSHGYSFRKLGRRNSFTLPIVGAAAALTIEDNKIKWVRIALNSVAPTPVRARSVEEKLAGAEASPETVAEAARLVLNDISPISDVRASREYRLEMAAVLTREALLEAISRAGR